MAGRGRTPKESDKRVGKQGPPQRGEWKAAEGIGWQHGKLPEPPDGLLKPSREAWRIWFEAWFAAFWTPGDMPGLRIVIRLYDQVGRGEFKRAGELRLWMDSYGITPRAKQDRRWAKPGNLPAGVGSAARYGHLNPRSRPDPRRLEVLRGDH